MKFAIAVAFLCLSSSALCYEDDGSYKGEGLLESQDYGQYNHDYQYPTYGQYVYSGYHSGAPLGADGQVVDTPEVAQAKAAHYAALAAANHGPAAPLYASSHGGAHIELTADGNFLKDTPEVAQAKAAHLAALAAANHGSSAPAYAGAYGSYGAAHVELTPDGKYLKDTPEVAQAKAAHLAALHAVSSHSNHYYENAPVAHGYAAHYGVANIELTPDGKYIKDTPEVAHAKAQHLAAVAAASGHAYHHY